MRVKMSKQPPPAPTASAVGPCPTVIQIVGRPGTGSLPSIVAPPDHPQVWSGVAGLTGRVFTVHAGSQRFNSHRRYKFERFFRSNRPGYLHPVSSELVKVISEWWSVTAVSLNVGGGVCLIKVAKLYICMQNTTYKIMCLIWFSTQGWWPH